MKIKPIRKKANILTENLVFIILNLAFIALLLTFVYTKTGSSAVLEEKYAKQIALIIDSAKPPMEVKLNMNRAKDVANENEVDFSEVSSFCSSRSLASDREYCFDGVVHGFFTVGKPGSENEKIAIFCRLNRNSEDAQRACLRYIPKELFLLD